MSSRARPVFLSLVSLSLFAALGCQAPTTTEGFAHCDFSHDADRMTAYERTKDFASVAGHVTVVAPQLPTVTGGVARGDYSVPASTNGCSVTTLKPQFPASPSEDHLRTTLAISCNVMTGSTTVILDGTLKVSYLPPAQPTWTFTGKASAGGSENKQTTVCGTSDLAVTNSMLQARGQVLPVPGVGHNVDGAPATSSDFLWVFRTNVATTVKSSLSDPGVACQNPVTISLELDVTFDASSFDLGATPPACDL